jgi:hypothetical protein
MAGLLFETISHVRFGREIFIQALPMFRRPGAGGPSEPRWQSSHYLFKDRQMEVLRQDALKWSFTLHVRPIDICEYKDLDTINIQEGIYYIPESQTEPAFIWWGGFLNLLQFTVSKGHEISKELIPRLFRCQQLPEQLFWRFIIVIPDDLHEIETLYSPTQETSLFSAKLVVADGRSMGPEPSMDPELSFGTGTIN